MSTTHPHTGATPDAGAAAGRRAWHGATHADDFPVTVRELRNQLDRLGYRAKAGHVGGEEVRNMQARVAELRDTLERNADGDPRLWSADPPDDAHVARTRYYENRIHAALADMATQLGDAHWSDSAPPGLDVASRTWLDQRFAALRDQLEESLAQQSPPDRVSDALEDARARLDAMERQLDISDKRQKATNDQILRMIDARIRDAIAPDEDHRLDTLDTRLQALQQGFDRAMGELDTMKKGTQRLAIRASVTVARHTARATAQHVARAVREVTPEQRFASLEEGLSGCMDETRMLRHEAGVIQQTVEDGLEDLRGRINELTLVTRKALSPQSAAAGAAASSSGPSAPPPGSHSAGAATRKRQTHGPRPGSPKAPVWGAGTGASLISRLGLAVVVALLIAASFAMLYAQMSGGSWRLPVITDHREAPASTSKRDQRQPTPVRNESEGRVILPGIILTGDAPHQV